MREKLKEIAEIIANEIVCQNVSLEGECTLANMVFYRFAQETDMLGSVSRIQGAVIVDGEEHEHEWLEIEGTVLDITAEQFGEITEYAGEETEFKLFGWENKAFLIWNAVRKTVTENALNAFWN